MAFTDDAVQAKLSALNETQDSIVSVAQWIMFYRRHADRAAHMWLGKLKESNTSKKLNLIYLANEIMQQAKVRKKDDFLNAFMPIIAEATAVSYKGATQEVQLKIRRVVEVWRQRGVLDTAIQDATEARIDELDKNRSAKSTGARLGGSLFGSSQVAGELQPITQQHAALSKAEATARPLITKANTDYADQTDPNAVVPSAPVQAGRLSSLMKSLASAESAVNDSMKARRALIEGLEKVMENHKSKLTEEETTASDFSTRRAKTEAKRKEVEDIIFRRVSAADSPSMSLAPTNGSPASNGPDQDRPEMESFTPPPPDVEQLTPDLQPQAQAPDQQADHLEIDTYAADPIQEQQPSSIEAPPAFEPPPAMSNGQFHAPPATLPAGMDFLKTVIPSVRSASSGSPTGTSLDPRKRRKMSYKAIDEDDQIFASGDGIGLDDDVAASLGA